MDGFTKLMIILVSISFLPVSVFFMKLMFVKKLKESKQKEEHMIKEQSYVKDTMMKQKIKEIYEQERKPYYEQAKGIFNTLMKNAKMSHDQIMYLRKLLENSLGEKVHDFDDFTYEVKNKKGETFRKKGFQNDAHRIYCYMKSYSIDEKDWKKIIDFLRQCEEIARVG